MRELTAARRPPQFLALPGFEALAPAARYILRGGDAVRQCAQAVAGVGFSMQACRALTEGERAVLWLGPDEWLLIAPEAEGAALASSLEAALAHLPHSLVDVSHR
ncbi:MAG TPA: sarcosine oxidase subunit gamma family protein, partial [Steroidobacteraceae bacterium]|nr:sarcosine oxidase subunit gamma family protein [Steroidobacteraceae bacterium]